MPQASRVEEEIKVEFTNANIKLTPSFGGDFRVIVEDKTLFDKNNLSRFPDEGEILKKLKES